MSIEAMKQMVEALSQLASVAIGTDHGREFAHQVDMAVDAMQVGRQAIAEAEKQEPMAITESMAFAFHNAITDGALGTDDLMDIMRGLEAAFANTSPPQRQPLTDEEMYLAIRPLYQTDALAQAALNISKDEYRAIEAKLKEKNT